jgi:predicted CxxxxCH...CXXCH cytochrome family protein
MKLLSSVTSILFLTVGIITFESCAKEEVCATWDVDVKPIIAATCSYSGCHSGGTTANGYLPQESNDYTSYAAIKASLDNGNFELRALVNKNMPNASFVPAGMPTALTQDQLDILQCWVDGGFPEN